MIDSSRGLPACLPAAFVCLYLSNSGLQLQKCIVLLLPYPSPPPLSLLLLLLPYSSPPPSPPHPLPLLLARTVLVITETAPKPSPSVSRPPVAISIPSAIVFDLSYSIIKFTTDIGKDALLCPPLRYRRNSMVRHFPPNIVRSLQCLFVGLEEFLSSWLLLKLRFDQFTAFPCSPFPFRGVFLFFFCPFVCSLVS